MLKNKLPLFPLNTVLFPGVHLTLHIFEERYRLMIGKCLDEQEPFGVIFFRQNDGLSDESQPYTMGTIARINASVRLEDGRFLISTVGEQRFQIQDIVQEVPYLVASVVLMHEEHEEDALTIGNELKTIYEQYWQAVTIATGSNVPHAHLPDEATAMGYQLAHRMQVTNERKQHWLETSCVSRTREMIAMLRTEMSLLPRPEEHNIPSGSRWHWSWN